MTQIMDITSISLLVLAGIALVIQMVYYLGIFSRLAFYQIKVQYQKPAPVSVIICARNEYKKLRKYLPKILEQDYFEYEVVVVNDCSFDESGELLKEFSAKYPHLKVVTILEQEKYQHGKKFALTLGIKGASHDLLLLTDADCEPDSKNWLANMQSNFVPGTDIVIGYGAYQKKSSLLNKIIRFDTFYNAIQYLSFALMGNTYMGVGRNLAYRKNLFFQNKGFANHYHLLSGDDDLFINEVATPSNTRVELRSESFTHSEASSNFKSWFFQKKRHLTTYPNYKPKHKAQLATFSLSTFLFYATLIALIAIQMQWQIILGIYFIRFLVQIVIFWKSMRLLKEIDLLPLFPFFDFLMVLMYPALAIANLYRKPKRWR